MTKTRPPPGPAVEHQPLPRCGAGTIATASAILVYVIATSAEIAVIERLRPGEMELTWISDAVLAVAFGFAVFLWLHLKWTRLSLSRLERAHIVLDTQLSMAANIQRSLVRDPLLLASSGPPAGLFPDQKYRTASLAIPEGAVSILVTDGITEALEILGTANGHSVAAIVAGMPPPLVPSRICDALIEYTASALAISDWTDDRTVVAFAFDSRTGASSSQVLP